MLAEKPLAGYLVRCRNYGSVTNRVGKMSWFPLYDVYLCRIWALVRHQRRNAGFTSYPTLALHYLSITIARFEVTLELVKIKIFRAKNFNFFYKYKSENASENTAARTYITEKFSANSKNFFSQ